MEATENSSDGIPGDRPAHCELCGAYFANETALRSHRNMVHFESSRDAEIHTLSPGGNELPTPRQRDRHPRPEPARRDPDEAIVDISEFVRSNGHAIRRTRVRDGTLAD
jgi:hypothetical protein